MAQKLTHSVLIMSILGIGILSGCDPGYSCYVRNKTSEVIYLKTKPPIENYSTKISKDSPLSKPMYGEDSTATYKLNPADVVYIQGSLGFKPDEASFPYSYLELIYNSQKDTLTFTNKKSIINALKQDGKKRKYYMDVQ